MNKYISPLILFLLAACRGDEPTVPPEYKPLPGEITADSLPSGMYVLNEGNMGSNKSTIDFADFRNGVYIRNLYPERNPSVIKELGDVGNDIQIYGSRLYAVINCSHKVEVMDACTCKRIGQVDIPNCRYIRFLQGNAYVSSYVGPVAIDPNAQLGAVFRVDTASLQVTGTVTVSYQPDEMEITDEYIYVANSGGYRGGSGKTEYDNTVSVVEINSMKQVRKIPVGINLHRIRRDSYGKLWVSSRGNYKNIPSRLFVLDRKNPNSREMVVTDSLDIPCSNMCIRGDSLYFYSAEWNEQKGKNTVSYGIINVKTKQLVTSHFITDGTEKDIAVPYGIQVNPVNGDIYVTDAKNYVSSGTLHCYDRNGKLKWSEQTGDIPAHMCFLN
ncbi:MAG: YncE family protein [Dysgonamonadaceae bacterium]|jgi:DNA-binding beta-propeller fold protein YncE|nr:YncE family protein [Dysgonamonadaceae bacterium]